MNTDKGDGVRPRERAAEEGSAEGTALSWGRRAVSSTREDSKPGRGGPGGGFALKTRKTARTAVWKRYWSNWEE